MKALPPRLSYERARRQLAANLLRERIIRSPALADAFRSVPREIFVPPAPPDAVYADTTIPVASEDGAWLTTSSQPAMMALMLEQLALSAGLHVLEIGAGTGYNAAILSRLAGTGGQVHTVEVEPEAAALAAAALAGAGFSARVHCGDGAEGWAPGAPYDRILATVAVWDIPLAWSEQLSPGGRIVAPLTVAGSEYSMALERDGEAYISRSLEPCAFVRFKGRLAHPDTRLAVGELETGQPALLIAAEPAQIPATATVQAWLQNGRGQPIEPFAGGAWDGFVLWMLKEHGPGRLLRAQSMGLGLGWKGPAVGLWDDDGMALVTASGRLEHFGAGGASEQVNGNLSAWREAGSPSLDRFRFRLVPGLTTPGPARLPRFRHTLTIEELGR